jgi:hypothetical protein
VQGIRYLDAVHGTDMSKPLAIAMNLGGLHRDHIIKLVLEHSPTALSYVVVSVFSTRYIYSIRLNASAFGQPII